MSGAQLGDLGLPAASARTVELAGATACTWTADDVVSLSLSGWDRRDLLVDTYRARLLPVFIPTTVASLPAVFEKSTPDSLSCTLTVGVAEGQALDATWDELGRASGRSDRDPCERAKAAAEAVVSTLPPLS